MNRTRGRCAGQENGSVSVLTIGSVFLACVLVLISVDLMKAFQAKARAQTAADAAALAAAQEIAIPSGRTPEDVASEYAQRDGATLVSCACAPGATEAQVEVEAPIDLIFLSPGRTVVAVARAVIGRGGARVGPTPQP